MCLSPDAAANKSAAAAIAAGGRDGSNESMHYADPTYVSQNAPLIVKQPGTTVHDPTFWQPLNAQRFVDPQWGRVKTFAGSVHVGKPPFGIPSTAAYKDAAIAVLRATSGARASRVDTSPLAWNRIAIAAATGNLAQDLRLYRTLNGALNDAAVSAWAAKRAYQAPRPISMIRYLAFNEQLPIVAGVTKLVGKTIYVKSRGRWIPGSAWTSPAPTPASPGWVSAASAFAYAGSTVLTSLTGRSFTAQAERLATAGVAEGIETPADESAGRTVGETIGKRALAHR